MKASKLRPYDVDVMRGFLMGSVVLCLYITDRYWGNRIDIGMIPLTVILTYISVRFSLKHPF